jgi:hypothetical protein
MGRRVKRDGEPPRGDTLSSMNPRRGVFARPRSAVRLCRRGSLLAARNVKPECDLRLILFNELPINEGNSRQR